ncbi:MAG: pyridoxal phosphate-dependent aminotransferase [bacterium]|nr:pyridoxal phosphate-dependent aminotransferase [bacterium]
MPFSRIADSIGASATLALNAEAARLRAAGEPVIHLGGGEPKSRAPESAVTAGIAMLETGEVRYSPASGTPEMKDAVVAYTERFYGRKPERTQVLASAGCKQAIMVALIALVDPGDEVVYPVPYWVSYPDMVRLTGGVPVEVRAADGSCQPTLDEMAAACGPRTKAILLNSPNNPSGGVFDQDFMRGMVKLCEERGIHLLMDDIYHRLVFDGRQAIHGWDFTDRDLDDTPLVVLNGVSKMYAMTGFRIGWAVGPRALIKAMGNIQSHQTGGPSTLAQKAAVASIHGQQDSVDELRVTLEKNRDVLLGLVREIPGLKVERPQGTFYCFADFSAFDKDCARLAAYLLDKVQVVTVPGVEFGMPGYLRLSYCGPVEDAREGARRIAWALDKNGPAEYRVGDRVFTR